MTEDKPAWKDRGPDPDLTLPLAIAAVVFGVVGLSQPALSWVALLVSAAMFVAGRRRGATVAFAIIGASLGLVGVVSSVIG